MKDKLNSVYTKRGEKVVELRKENETVCIRAVTFNTFQYIDEKYSSYVNKNTECFCCEKDFKNGQLLSTLFTYKGNRAVCINCASYICFMLENDWGR